MQYLLLRGLLCQQQECFFLCIWNRFCTDQSVKVKNSLDYGKLSAAAERAIKTRHSLQLWCPAVISDVKVQMCSLKMLLVMSTMMQLHQHLFTLHVAGQVSEARNSRFVSELCKTSARTGSSDITTASAIYQPPKGARMGGDTRALGWTSLLSIPSSMAKTDFRETCSWPWLPRVKATLHSIVISNILRNQKVFFSELKTNWYSSGTIASADAWGYVSEG